MERLALRPRTRRPGRARPALPEGTSRERELIELDGELSDIAVAAAERGLRLSAANANIHDPEAYGTSASPWRETWTASSGGWPAGPSP